VFDQKRARKKKALTDPVQIIGFPGQSEKPTKQPKVKQNKQDAPPPTIPTQKEARKLSNPTGKLNNSFLGIKELYEQAEKKGTQPKEEINTNKPQEKFSLDQLRMSWRKFAFQMRDEGQDTLFTALTGRDPILKEDNVVVHFVDNDVQLRFLKTNETKLLGFLRKELKNWSITISIEEGSAENGEKKLYSGKEKFEDMAERNPHLKTLRQKFKLDIDF
tara:strand:+ start:174343 stop:174996 length:654 start_codon:yes stop_codon:yes gene_type:complete